MPTKKLTYTDLAELYYKKTGKSARTKAFDKIYEWAIGQPEVKINNDTSLSWR